MVGIAAICWGAGGIGAAGYGMVGIGAPKPGMPGTPMVKLLSPTLIHPFSMLKPEARPYSLFPNEMNAPVVKECWELSGSKWPLR